MSFLPFKSKCTNCAVTIRGLSQDHLDCGVKAHYHKKHPVVYALAQEYIEVDKDTLSFKSIFKHKKRRRDR